MLTKWYAASLQSNRELQAQKYLDGQGVPNFLPTYQTSSNRKDRFKTLVRPLFPGYIFVHIDIPGTQKLNVLKCPGVCGIVSFAGIPAPIDNAVVDSLKIITGASNGEVKPHPLIRQGQKVVVKNGPFAGAVGLLHESESKKKQLVVEIDFLGRAIAVPIAPEQVAPVL